MTKRFIISIILILGFSLPIPARAVAQTELEIAGVTVKVIGDRRDYKTQFISVVVPTTLYPRKNLEKVWRYFCDEKYPDKNIKLDLRVYTEETYLYNKPFAGMPVDLHTREAILPD